MAVTAEASTASAAMAAERNRAAGLQRQLDVVQAEKRELVARVAAGQLEAAGSSEVG